MSVQELARLKARASDLRDRRIAVTLAQQENEAASQAMALKSALDEATPPRGFEQVAGRAVLLAAQAAALDQALANADVEVGQAETMAEMDRQVAERRAVRANLEERLQLAGDIEAALRALLPKVAAFSALGSRIERCAGVLDGHARILPPLAPEAAGGRLAEFMAGLGFGAWLPLIRPETRPAIAALKEAEAALQRPYLARFEDAPLQEPLP
jgi:multidrug efflux pump subunit AcrA (membrane-fusion protein)